MPVDNQRPKDVKFFLLFIPVAYLTYLIHEFGHWSVGEILGNPMVFSMNLVWPRDGRYLGQNDALYVSLGGPGFTVLQAALALFVIEKAGARWAYPFAFFPMYNRFFSDFLGGFSRQDEARIAVLLGISIYLVAFIVLTILLVIVIWSSYRLKLDFKTIGYIITVSTACQLLVIATYEFLKL